MKVDISSYKQRQDCKIVISINVSTLRKNSLETVLKRVTK
nr:MAG TPA: hypothetical protein [Bacteriophage sp.]